MENAKIGSGKPGPGRPKGCPNKVNKALKDMILGALDKAGGEEYLLEQAKLNPTAFLTLIGKVLPTQLTGEGGSALTFKLEAPWWQEVMTARGEVSTDTPRALNS